MAEEQAEILYPCGCCCERCYHRRAGDGNCLFHIYAPEMAEMLKELEWPQEGNPCVMCFRWLSEGHKKDCVFKALLDKIDGSGE